MTELVFFYDGMCPLCTKEVRLLKHWDTQHKIRFVDVQDEEIQKEFPQFSFEDLMAVLHVQTLQGEVYKGVEATIRAWQAAGKGGWVRWLNWWPICYFSRWAYAVFAKNRQRFSRLIMGNSDCNC